MADMEGSLESMGRSAPPAGGGGVRWRGGPGPAAARCRTQRELDSEAEAAAIARAWELEKERQEKLFHKAMLFYYLQASEEESVRMEEPIG
jgi:hypothetical protein